MVCQMEIQITRNIWILWLVLGVITFNACNNQKEHTAPAINERDSVSMMKSYGISTLISDSGVMKYRIIAERWEVNEVLNPPRWIFKRGIFIEQFDEKFHAEAYIQADTAFYYNIKKLWHLIGNVRVKTVDGLRFNSEELYWDQNRHELYSYRFSKVTTPERQLEGTYFISDEQMKHYTVSNSVGAFNREENDNKKNETAKGDTAKTDTVPKREPIVPRKKP